MRRRAALGTIVALAAAACAPVAAEARFSVSPTVVHVDGKPGTAASGTFDVRVAGEEDREFTVEVQDVVQRPDGSTSFEPPSDSPFSASSWVSVSPEKFSGDPNRTQPVRYTVRVPRKATPGDHVTSLTVTRLPEESDALAQPVQAISVRLTVNVFGRARPRAEITSFDAPGVSGGSPVEVSAVVENTGNVTLDFDGKQSGSLSILQGDEAKATEDFTGQLFPGQSRSFELAWDDPPLIGQLRALASVDTGRGEPVTRTDSFWQFPWRQLGALVLVTLAATILVAGRRTGRF